MAHFARLPMPPSPPLQLQQQKRSASAELPYSAFRPPSAVASSVPPKKRARNHLDDEQEEATAATSAAAASSTSATPLDLSAPGRTRQCDRSAATTNTADEDNTDAAGTAAAAAAAAYMARCTESFRMMNTPATAEDPAATVASVDCWTALNQWQASLHAQYLYYSSLALSGLMPPPPPPPPPHSAMGGKLHPAGLLSSGFNSLFASMPTPQPPPLPSPLSQAACPTSSTLSLSQRSVQEGSPSPSRRQQLTPQPPTLLLSSLLMQQQPRRTKPARATPAAGIPAPVVTAVAATAASTPGAAKASPTSSLTSAPERQLSGETDFQCSCSRAFASLIGLTLHLKETGHGPGAACGRDRDIPKLVRGQDMWINSETEQTREILRCIRCKQSFRTLPELTMHMMKTRHYTEIIYTDSAPSQQQQQQQQQQQSSAGPSATARLGSQAGKDDRPATASGNKERAGPQHSRGGRAEVKEADSATDPQRQQGGGGGGCVGGGGATSTLQKMQHFVEVSLPRPGLRRPGMFQEVLQSSVFDGSERGGGGTGGSCGDSDNDDDRREGGGGLGGTSRDCISYLSPDRPSEQKENPLSSLQKLVDTAEKTSVPGAAPTTAATSAAMTLVAAATATTSTSPALTPPTTTLAPLSAARPGSPATSVSSAVSNRHTVIMLSPTYIYQSGLYQSAFPMCHPPALVSPGGGSPMDLSRLQRSDEASAPKKPASSAAAANTLTSAASVASTAAVASLTLPSGSSELTSADNPAGGWPDSLMQKKAKCHYCSKPFANKGQVRLHVSKGKCPSLLARLPTAALPPFPFFPALDYIKAAGRFHAAAAAAAAAASVASGASSGGSAPAGKELQA